MARGVTNGEKDRLVFRACLFERFTPPGVPIDRIVRVLLEIRAFLVDQAIGVHTFIVECAKRTRKNGARIWPRPESNATPWAKWLFPLMPSTARRPRAPRRIFRSVKYGSGGHLFARSALLKPAPRE